MDRTDVASQAAGTIPTPSSLESKDVPATPDLSNRALLAWMFTFVRPVKALSMLCCLYLAVYIGMEVLTTHQLGEAVTQIKQLTVDPSLQGRGVWGWLLGDSPGARALLSTVALLTAFVLATFALRYLREVTNTRFSMEMVFFIREAVYDKLQRVGFRFHDAVSTGQLINRSLTDLNNVRSFIQTALLSSLEIVLVVGGYMVLILQISPWLALLSLLPLPVWCWYILNFSRRIRPISKSIMEAGDKNVQIITESIAGVHVVKAFATEKQELDKYNKHCDVFFGRMQRAINMYARFGPTMRLIGGASHLLLFLFASILIIKGGLEVGDFLKLGTAMGAILTRLQAISVISEQYQNAIVSARRLHEILTARPTVPESPDARPLPPGRGALTFENVTFGYDPERPVLKDVSFHIPGGTMVAITGPTGSGKSTLVNLISRFYDPTQGRVLIDGVDLRDVTLASVRSQVSYVFQETYLFSDTVEANIAYGRPGVTGGEVEAAARLAQAHDFIEAMPQGYQTVLAERGSSLSGGQRQRLAIARAILTTPRILVLDDATAAVDPETEDMIRRAMSLTMEDRTVIVIAHRISTLKRADIVIVMEAGRITQMGTHDELMRQEGHYRQIAAAQLYGDDQRSLKHEAPSHMDRMGALRVTAPETASAPASPEDAAGRVAAPPVPPAVVEGRV
jgi:ATP-binding cassette subfamily B protein